MKSLILYIYCQKPSLIIFCIAVIVLLWTLLSVRKIKALRILNLVALAISVFGILCATVIGRQSEYVDKVYPIPFSIWFRAIKQPELYREMLMNVFLFVPFGVTASFHIPEKYAIWKRILLTITVSFAFSFILEIIQYVFGFGMAEMDDVLCNTFGGFIGAMTIPIAEWIRIIIEKRKMQ